MKEKKSLIKKGRVVLIQLKEGQVSVILPQH